MKNYFIALLFGCLYISSCEPLTLKGQVLDEQKLPVVNASLFLKSEGNMGICFCTDGSGRFSIKGCGFTDTLMVYAKGFYSETLPVSLCLKRSLFICLQKKPADTADFSR